MDDEGWQTTTTEKKRKPQKTTQYSRNGPRKYNANGTSRQVNGHARPRNGYNTKFADRPAATARGSKLVQPSGMSSQKSIPQTSTSLNSSTASIKPGAGTWANIVKPKEAPIEIPKPIAKPPVETSTKPSFSKATTKVIEEKSDIQSDKIPLSVDQIEAELIDTEPVTKTEPILDKPKPKEPLVKPGIKFSKKLERVTEKSKVSGVGDVRFGSNEKVTVTLQSVVEDSGKEVLLVGTKVMLEKRIDELGQDLERARAEGSRYQKEMQISMDKVNELNAQVNELMSEVTQKKQLEEEVSALKSKIEALESKPPPSNAPPNPGPGAPPRGYYPNPGAGSPKEPGQLPKSAAPNHQGQFPPPQMYGPPMGYYHNYYSPYPPAPPNFSSPPRGYYENHPPQPQQGSNDYGHNEEYRGSNSPPVNVNPNAPHPHSNTGMRRREDKGPPGYNVGQQPQGQQFYPYIYQGQVGYQQQQQPHNQSRGPQGWNRQ